MDDNWMTVAEAATLANRTTANVHRWLAEGWLHDVHKSPGYNGKVWINRKEFQEKLPTILDIMSNRHGGHGRKELDGRGQER